MFDDYHKRGQHAVFVGGPKHGQRVWQQRARHILLFPFMPHPPERFGGPYDLSLCTIAYRYQVWRAAMEGLVDEEFYIYVFCGKDGKDITDKTPPKESEILHALLMSRFARVEMIP